MTMTLQLSRIWLLFIQFSFNIYITFLISNFLHAHINLLPLPSLIHLNLFVFFCLSLSLTNTIATTLTYILIWPIILSVFAYPPTSSSERDRRSGRSSCRLHRVRKERQIIASQDLASTPSIKGDNNIKKFNKDQLTKK